MQKFTIILSFQKADYGQSLKKTLIQIVHIIHLFRIFEYPE